MKQPTQEQIKDNSSLKLMYDILLATTSPELLKKLKSQPELYEQAFNSWLDKTIDEAVNNSGHCGR